MNLLIGDTSGAQCLVALCQDDRVLARVQLDCGRTHMKTFFRAVEAALSLADCRHTDLDAYACVVGPGSFTGLRIAVSGMKMMAYAANKPVFPLSSLQARADSLHYARQLQGVATKVISAPALDARNRRVFAAAYTEDGSERLTPCATSLNEWVQALTKRGESDRSLILAGSVYQQLDEEEVNCLRSAYGAIQILPDTPIEPLALYDRVVQLHAAGLDGKPELLMPDYLVPSQAERLEAESAQKVSPHENL